MKATCEDELVIDCAGYKAIDTGVILFGDEDRDDVIAFVPDGKLQYLLPEDIVEREHEQLGLPAPEIASPEDLESRLAEFAGEVDDLREQLDHQVEEIIDEGATLGEEDFDRQERLHERRRTIDRSLQQVRQRAQQFRQLSTVEAEAGGEQATIASATPESGAGETTATDVESLRTEMDERFETIESCLQELAATVERTSGEAAAEGTEPPGGSDGERTAEDADPFENVEGLGPTFSSRLRDAGVTTLRDLAERGPEAVADAANTSQSRASSWVDQAESLLEDRKQEA